MVVAQEGHAEICSSCSLIFHRAAKQKQLKLSLSERRVGGRKLLDSGSMCKKKTIAFEALRLKILSTKI